MKQNKLLTAKNLSYKYNKKHLFTDISFYINSGKALQVKGINGAGKTTLLELITGLRALQQGKLCWQDEKPHHKLKCSFLSAEFNGNFQGLNGFDNLKFWSSFLGYNFSEKKLLDELRNWGLDARIIYSNMEVKKYSTGMKKRLALARIFMFPSTLLVLDEPTNGLDSHAREIFLSKLKLHLKTGGGLVITSHEIDLLQSLNPQEITLG